MKSGDALLLGFHIDHVKHVPSLDVLGSHASLLECLCFKVEDLSERVKVTGQIYRYARRN